MPHDLAPLLEAVQKNDLPAMIREIRGMGGIEVLQRQRSKNDDEEDNTASKIWLKAMRRTVVDDDAPEDVRAHDPMHLLHAFRLANSIGVDVMGGSEQCDESLRSCFKVARILSNTMRLPGEIFFDGSDRRSEGLFNAKDPGAGGMASVMFSTEVPSDKDFRGWNVMESHTAELNCHGDTEAIITRASLKGRVLIEKCAESFYYHKDTFNYSTAGTFFWNFASLTKRKDFRQEDAEELMEKLQSRLHPIGPALEAFGLISHYPWQEKAGLDELTDDERTQYLSAFIDSGWKINDPLTCLGLGRYGLLEAAVCMRGEQKTLDMILDLGANPNRMFEETDQSLVSRLIKSCTPCGPEQEHKARLLLSMGERVDAADSYGTTPLMLACKQGKPNMVKILLEVGADIHLKNHAGMSALDISKVDYSKEPGMLRWESSRPLLDAHSAGMAIQDVIDRLEHSSKGVALSL